MPRHFWGAMPSFSVREESSSIPAVVEGVVSIRTDDIGEFHCTAQ
jgi:hypothetical protein